MTFLAALLIASTLTRAEIIDRMRATPITKVNGLVQVIGHCPQDMRDEFQMPVATYVADVCEKLYSGRNEKPVRFTEPGIVVYIGDVRTNLNTVVVHEKMRDSGKPYTRIFLPAPAYADLIQLRREAVKAFYLAVVGERLDDAAAEKALRQADPELRLAEQYADIARWHQGEKTELNDDEEYIRLSRAILKPGVAHEVDILRFASRLHIYPEVFSAPFCGKYRSVSFKEAIDHAPTDARIRVLAHAKASQVVVFGGGRGATLAEAANAYAKFLFELAAYKKTPEELRDLLEDADEKLNVAMEEARLRAEGKLK